MWMWILWGISKYGIMGHSLENGVLIFCFLLSISALYCLLLSEGSLGLNRGKLRPLF